MNILALDTSADVLSLSLSSPDGIRSVEIEAGPRHSESLMEWVDKLFKSTGLEPEDLELVACMKGPGSFTGLRIAYAAAKGLSMALGIPLAAIPSLDCMAYPLSIWPGIALPVIDAKKNCFFAAFYRRGTRLSDYLDMEPRNILLHLDSYKLSREEKVVISGPGAELFISRIETSEDRNGIFVDPLFSRGRSLELLQIVKNSYIINITEDVDSGPLYIRKSDAEIKLEPLS